MQLLARPKPAGGRDDRVNSRAPTARHVGKPANKARPADSSSCRRSQERPWLGTVLVDRGWAMVARWDEPTGSLPLTPCVARMKQKCGADRILQSGRGIQDRLSPHFAPLSRRRWPPK